MASQLSRWGGPHAAFDALDAVGFRRVHVGAHRRVVAPTRDTPLRPLARVTGRASEGGVRGDYGLPETMTNFVELDAHNSKPADLRRVTEFDDDERIRRVLLKVSPG